MKADAIILICLPEQLPFFKVRYGDIFFDTQHQLDVRDSKTLRPIPIYYTCVAEKYLGKYDSETFNMFYISNVFLKAVDESFGMFSPTHFIYILPYACIFPGEWVGEERMQSRKLHFFQLSIETRQQLSKFQLKLKSGQFLPNSSHTILRVEEVKEIWNEIKQMITDENFNKIPASKFAEITPSTFIDKYKNYELNFEINDHNFYDLRKWENYVEAMNYLCKNRLNEDHVWTPAYCNKYISHMPALTYHLSGPIISDDSYVVKDLGKIDRNTVFEKWKRDRKKLRKGK